MSRDGFVTPSGVKIGNSNIEMLRWQLPGAAKTENDTKNLKISVYMVQKIISQKTTKAPFTVLNKFIVGALRVL
jgi:hypothetical protein